MKKHEREIEKALMIDVVWNGFQYVALSKIPYLHTVVGYGKTEQEAKLSLLLKSYTVSFGQRKRFFDAVDSVFKGGEDGDVDPFSFAYEFLDDGCKVTVTDDAGRSSSRKLRWRK